ncbi:hypothetical protein CEXT_464761 [Caerostris extrusa]|uniref:Uncharacterized protein n=1 Tax=Caerostris extrusa TaxID=172846 RepID=A0AAV4S679_CAEEX|nr:hypothetical protein CEXT_464761 [Caerostris extrusa]
MTVHVLEDQFTTLHGLVNNAPSSEFDDFVLPKPPILILDCSVQQPRHLPPNVSPLLLHVRLLPQLGHALIQPGVPLSLVVHRVPIGKPGPGRTASTNDVSHSQTPPQETTIAPPAMTVSSSATTFPFGSRGLRNHLAGHKREQLRAAAPKLSLPAPSTKKRNRRKRGNNVLPDIIEPSTVSDPAAVLAQPVLQTAIQVRPDDSIQGPLVHFLEPLDVFSSDQFSPSTFGPFEDLVEDITQAAITHLFPDGPQSNGTSTSATAINVDDPATCQRLYTRNRRRAVREIVGNVGDKCNIPLDNLAQHFFRMLDC